MRYANIYIYIFVLHRGFFQQPRPRVGICKSRLDALTCKYMNINISSIANLGHRAPSWQCRRGDASPPGEDPPPNKTAKLQFMDSNLHKKITSASEDLQKLFFYALYALLSRCLASYCSR